MVRIPVVIVRLVIRALRVAEHVRKVCRLEREMPVFIEVQCHPVGGAEATADEEGERDSEDGAGAESHD